MSSSSANAISGSTIQNSVRCRRVFDFSARNVGPKRIHLAQRHRRRFDVELSRLRQERLLLEVVHRKQRGGALARRRREDRRIGQHESLLVEEIARRLDDLRPNAQDRRLARRAQPQVAMLHQEIDAVFLQRDRVGIVFRDLLHHLHVADVQLVAAGGALVGPHLAAHDHARFLRQPLQRFEGLRRLVLRHHALDHARRRRGIAETAACRSRAGCRASRAAPPSALRIFRSRQCARPALRFSVLQLAYRTIEP